MLVQGTAEYFSMHYTVEELRGGWHVIQEDVSAPRELLAVAKASREPGMYRTAATCEPHRHYFWRSSEGRVEALDS
ncbi:MAG TPA: hypothetical protein VFJ61_00040 [Solirubrobacterales bacterium]|nr:hypothetical protein [Solirubrobacterales bacterium]